MSDPPTSPDDAAFRRHRPGPPQPSPPVEELEDQALLGRWVEQGDSHAIRELTRRHTSLVMGTAARALSGHQTLAEEAAQAVFTIMTAKAGALRHHPSLNLWLHRAALLEASGLRRRETRRRRHLARLAEELDTMHSPESPPEWQNALPELDEALERLPGPDRQLLILRYFEGRGFRDIAARVGKSDDTVQKQTSRAVEKLSRLLRRRGVVIPAAVLAPGLAGMAAIAPKASAALSGKLAASAITQASHFGFAPSLTHTLQLMAYTHTTKLAGGAAAVLLLLCGAAGYRSGTASAATDAAALAEANARPAFPQKTTPALRPPPDASFSATRRSTASDHRTPHPPLTEILQAAASIEMGINGDWSRYSESAYPALGHYDIADTEEAVALLPEFRKSDSQFESVAGLIFSVLAEKDWRKAKDRLLQGDSLRADGKLSAHAIRAVADAWGQEDPAAAFRWANGLADAGRTPFPADRGVGEKLLADWLKTDPAAALSEMDQRLNTQPLLIGDAVRVSLKQQPQWWLDHLSPEAPEQERTRMLRFARNAMSMVPEDGWQDLLQRLTKDPGLAASLAQQMKP